jgi:hypothetical protein
LDPIRTAARGDFDTVVDSKIPNAIVAEYLSYHSPKWGRRFQPASPTAGGFELLHTIMVLALIA